MPARRRVGAPSAYAFTGFIFLSLVCPEGWSENEASTKDLRLDNDQPAAFLEETGQYSVSRCGGVGFGSFD